MMLLELELDPLQEQNIHYNPESMIFIYFLIILLIIFDNPIIVFRIINLVKIRPTQIVVQVADFFENPVLPGILKIQFYQEF